MCDECVELLAGHQSAAVRSLLAGSEIADEELLRRMVHDPDISVSARAQASLERYELAHADLEPASAGDPGRTPVWDGADW